MTSNPWSSKKASIKSVILPNGLTTICKNAFSGFTQLESISIPNTVTSIGNSAFSGCAKLKEIVIPDSVTSIGTWVFEKCTALEKATIGNGVARIEDGAFQGCSSLAEVTIGESVTFIQYSTSYCYPAFSGCVNLKKVINKSMLPIIKGKKDYGEVALNADVVEFNWSSTCGENLTWTLNSEDYILRISGTGAMTSRPWSGMASVIEGVELGNGLTTICNNAFSGFTLLESISIPNTVTSIGNSAFSGCAKLKEIVIPDSVTSMGTWVFEKCTALEKATIGNGVARIEDGAFQGCSSLAEVTIGEAVTFIQHSTSYCYPAFSGCSNLKKVINKSMLPIIKGKTDNGEVALNADVVEFNWSSTCGENLTWTLNSEDYILRISGTGAMTSRPWSGMASVIEGVELGNGLTTICNNAFSGFTQITNISIPDSVTSMGTWVFEKCTALEKATIGNGVARIEEGAFQGCSSLAEVTIGASVSYIRNDSSYYWGAFTGCTNLATVFNRSNLVLTIGSTNQGGIAQYATAIYNTVEHKTAHVSDTTYNGNEQKQTVTIEGLTEGTDFDVAYSADCTNSGVVTVTVTGKGGYFGTLTATYNIAKADKTAPAVPEAQSVGKNSITLKAVEGCEYSIDGTAWQDSTLFEGLTIATSYTFYQRVKETANYKASPASSAEIATHSHEWAEWAKDSTHHWRTCSGCEDKDGYAEHAWDEGAVTVIPTRTTVGVKTYTCTVCSATRTEEPPTVEYVSGDINGDGKVNVSDLVRLAQKQAGWDVEVVKAALDINGDGKINVNDLVRLAQYLANWDVEIF